MNVAMYGNEGTPVIAFPPARGSEWDYEQSGFLNAIAEDVDAGRLRFYVTRSIDGDSFLDTNVEPTRRSLAQKMFDEYVRIEVLPFVRSHSPNVPIVTLGVAFGAFHAVNTLLKAPETVKRCYGFSGFYDVAQFMDRTFDSNFYFNNPLDYVTHIWDETILLHLSSCEVNLIAAGGRGRDQYESYRLGEVLKRKGIATRIQDWGDVDTEDWVLWTQQMRELLAEWSD